MIRGWGEYHECLDHLERIARKAHIIPPTAEHIIIIQEAWDDILAFLLSPASASEDLEMPSNVIPFHRYTKGADHATRL